MRYLGGKSKIAKKLSHEILTRTNNRETYIEPFLGGGAVATQMGSHFNHVSYSDVHPDLMLMWEHIFDGGTFNSEVDESEYQKLKNSEPSAYRGFIGFAGSFGGKFFGGYARGTTSDNRDRNYLAEGLRNIERGLPGMKGRESTEVGCCSFDEVVVSEGDVVYCDPPYASTTGYSTGDFDHEYFWSIVREWALNGADVFVSEYVAPEWVGDPIWKKEKVVEVKKTNKNTARDKIATECLYHIIKENCE